VQETKVHITNLEKFGLNWYFRFSFDKIVLRKGESMGKTLTPAGKLYTSNPEGLRYLKNPDAELWQITRGGPELKGTKLVRSLAPSPELFRTYVSRWRNLAPEKWCIAWSEYEKLYLDLLEKRKIINRIG
jgi:hypothetical protein